MTVSRPAPLPSVFAAILYAVTMNCSDRTPIVAPDPAIDGTWRIVRTAGPDPGCNILFEPEPTPLEIRFRVHGGVLETLPTNPWNASSLESDGTFELLDLLESADVFRETITIRGRFDGGILTAIESHSLLYLDPIMVDLFGSEPCVSTYGWAGERV